MKVIGLSCSARRHGNTVNALNTALTYLKEMGHDVEMMYLIDYDIKPCRNCEMECYYNKNCPTPDDSRKVIDLLEKADGLIVGSPLYNGTVPSLLAAFLERNPYPYDDVLKGKVTACIIIGSIGETFAALILTSWLAPNKHFIGWIDIDPRATAAREFCLKDSWLKGNIMDDEDNKERVRSLAYRLHSKMMEIKKGNYKQPEEFHQGQA